MTEDQLEQEALGWLADIGYTHRFGPDIAPDGPSPERPDYRQVVLANRLRDAIHCLNPDIPTSAREDALRQILDLGIPALLSANRQFHKLLVGGVPVQYQKDGETRGDFVRLIDWDSPSPHPSPEERGAYIALRPPGEGPGMRAAMSGWRSISSRSRAATIHAAPTSSCSSTVCRWS